MINQLILGLNSAFAWLRRENAVLFANNAQIVNITHKGRTTATADAAFTSRYLICKRGATSATIAVAGQGDAPYGVVPDMTPSTDTDTSYPLPINILGLNEDTERMIASGNIAIDDLITTDANGQVRSMTGIAAGTYWVLGKCKVATSNGANDQVEVIPCFPHKVTVTA
jgi:hypothetical protein